MPALAQEFDSTGPGLDEPATQIDLRQSLRAADAPRKDETLRACTTALHAFAEERREAMCLMHALREGRIDSVAMGTLQWPGHHGCEFGLWLRSLPAQIERHEALSDLRMWHEEWHAGVERCFRLANAGEIREASRLLLSRRGKLDYAHRALERSLVALCCALAGEHAPGPIRAAA